jgi:hypothetical protein
MIAEQAEVLPVRRLEDKPHAGSDPFAADRAEHALGPDHEHDQQHNIGGNVLEALRQVGAGKQLVDPDGEAARKRPGDRA